MVRNLMFALALAAPALFAAGPADAAVFHLTYNTYVDSTSGPSVALDALITADPSGYGDDGYFVTAISGTRGSEALTFNDNFDEIFYPANTAGDFVDSFGLSFFAGATLYQFYKNGQGDFAYHEYDGLTGRLVFSDAVSLTPAAASDVPEPASWLMMIGGFGLIGSTLRRRPRAVSEAFRR